MRKKRKPKFLYERTNYVTSIRFINSTRIASYDIEKANISILRNAGVISNKTYDMLLSWPKLEREKYVGLMERGNDEIVDIIEDGIIDQKKKLFEANEIRDEEVIRIANDAVYVMRGVALQHLQFDDGVRFIHKNNYSLFARTGSLIFMFGSELGNDNLDIMGLGSQQIALHAEYMLNFIGNLFYLMEFSKVSDTMDYFIDFYNRYLARELPIQYYRELSPDSLYRIDSCRNGKNTTYWMSECNDVNIIDIGYNAQILRELFGFITEIHERTI